MKEELYFSELKNYLNNYVDVCPIYTMRTYGESRLYDVDSTDGNIELKTRPTTLSCIDWERLDEHFIPEAKLFLKNPNLANVAALIAKALQYREGGICLGDVLTYTFINKYPEDFI